MGNYRAEDVLEFWFGVGPDHGKRHKRWFEKDRAFDLEITQRFLPLYEALVENPDWLDDAPHCLARIIVLDQFPRQMFRGEARAFASDPPAPQAARLPL